MVPDTISLPTRHRGPVLNPVMATPIRPFQEAARESALIRQADVNTRRNHSASRMQQDIEVEAQQGRGSHRRARRVSRRGEMGARRSRGGREGGTSRPHSYELPSTTSRDNPGNSNRQQVVLRNPFVTTPSNASARTQRFLNLKIGILPRNVSYFFSSMDNNAIFYLAL